VKKIFFIFLVLLFNSCEYAYVYTYEITNETDSNIIVEIETIDNDHSRQIIEQKETKIILTTEHGIEKSTGPYFRDVSKDFKKCIISKNDTLSAKNYMDNSSWNYVKGQYKAIIRNDEFQ
jgi:hypothetical protein